MLFRVLKKGIPLSLSALMCITSFNLNFITIHASDSKINGISAKGLSVDGSGHDASMVVDGDLSTYWETPTAQQSVNSYKRNVDLDLNGLYDISRIKIFTKTDKYYQYSIYASNDGVTYDKVAYKADEKLGLANGEEYSIKKQARYLRVNINFMSGSVRNVDLNEIEVYGNLISSDSVKSTQIETDDFKDSHWGKEYERFETDKTYANQKVIKEASNLVGRVIGDEWKDSFVFELRPDSEDGKDIFEVESKGGKIVVRGNDGVSLAAGFNYYIKTYCKIDYNPLYSSNLNMPSSLPEVKGKITKETQYDLRYALNFCTYSYTMSFWNWDEYEEFLDWGAMNGVNLMLDIVGQEEVQRRLLREYGYSDAEIKDYLTGPAYFAWFYMQNMTSYGGPLPDNWFADRVELGRKMHDRMQSFGITPVMEGFAGMVPSDFGDKNKNAKIIPSGGWSGYVRPATIQTFLTDADKSAGKEDYFPKVADTFYKVQKDIYGDCSDYYAVDPFHEGGNHGDIAGQDTKIYSIIQNSMIHNDENAVWILQKWGSNANPTQLKDLDKKHIVVLDLWSEQSCNPGAMEESGTPWIWNQLHNFGGRMGMFGNPELLATKIPNDMKKYNNMVGIGITPEALNTSPALWELLFDMTWEQDPINVQEWVNNYIERRYGKTNEDVQDAWKILLDTVYQNKSFGFQGGPETVVNARPTMGKFTAASTYGHSQTPYDTEKFEKATQLLIKAYPEFKDSAAFKYDFIDVLAQEISNSGKKLQEAMAKAYDSKNLAEFDRLSNHFLEMVDLQDKILSTNKEYSVGSWINKSRKMITDADDWSKDLLELNARSLISVWGSSNNDSLLDYSNRQWSGLTSDVYAMRWKSGIKEFRDRIVSGNVSNKGIDGNKYWMMVWEWANKKSDESVNGVSNGYSETPTDYNLADLATKVDEEYSLRSFKTYLTSTAEEAKPNIALGKTVTCNKSTATDSPLKNLTDGNAQTNWAQANAEWPTELVVNLGGNYDIDGMDIKLPQVADDFKIGYKVYISKDGNWSKDPVAQEDIKTVNGSINIDYIGTGSQVKFVFDAPKDTKIVPSFAEFEIFGTKTKEVAPITLTNVALHKKAAAEGMECSTLSRITDGDRISLAAGTSTTNGSFIVDLDGSFKAENINVVMEAGNPFGFKFKTYVMLEDNTWKLVDDQSNNTQTNAQKNIFNTKLDGSLIKQVKVEYLGKTDGTTMWPGLAELEVMAPAKEDEIKAPQQNVAYKAPVEVSAGDGQAYNLTDNNLNTIWATGSSEFPATAKVDLGSEMDIDTTRVNFEMADVSPDGRAFKYYVRGYDNDNKLVFTDDQTNNSVKIPYHDSSVNKKIRYIEVELVGKASNEGAWPALAEIQAFAPLKNILKDSKITPIQGLDIKKLVDDDDTTGVVLSKKDTEFEFTLDKPRDIYAVELIKGKTAEALRYKVEVQAPDTDKYQLFIDGSKNYDDSVKVIASKEKVLSAKVKVTILNSDIELNEIKVYSYQCTPELLAIISDAETKVNAKTIGDKAGNYTQASKDAFFEGLDKIKKEVATKGEMNSVEIAPFNDQINNLYFTFILDGFVSINRSPIIGAIESANMLKVYLTEHSKESLLTEEFKTAMTEAKAIKNGDVSQAEIDAKAKALNEVTAKITSLLSDVEQYELVLAEAKNIVENTVVGELEGNVSQEASDTLRKVIQDAEASFAEDNANAALLKETLVKAIATFNKSKIVLDKSKLNALIESIDTYDSSLYSKTSWKALEAALTTAKDESKLLTQSQIDSAVKGLMDALKKLETLDRSQLSLTITDALKLNAKDYTKESWSKFSSAMKKAQGVMENKSVDQSDIDSALGELKEAKAGLKTIDKPSQPEIDKPSVPQKDITITTADNENQATGKFKVGDQLIISLLNDLESQSLISKLKDQKYVAKVFFEKIFDISVLRDNKTIKPDGKMVIRLKLDQDLASKQLQLLSITDNGSIELVPFKIENGYIVFSTTKLSKFAIVSYHGDNIPSTTPNTGDITQTGMLISVVLLAGASLLLLQRKRKRII